MELAATNMIQVLADLFPRGGLYLDPTTSLCTLECPCLCPQPSSDASVGLAGKMLGLCILFYSSAFELMQTNMLYRSVQYNARTSPWISMTLQAFLNRSGVVFRRLRRDHFMVGTGEKGRACSPCPDNFAVCRNVPWPIGKPGIHVTCG